MNIFDSENHIYRGDMGRLPGATDIIKSQGLVEVEWMSEECRWRGKVVHEAIRLENKGTLDPDSVAEEMRGYLDSYRYFLRVTGFKVIGYEQPLFDSAFGCMPDLWGQLYGLDTIIELKTGPVPKWAAIQTALQARALKNALGFIAVKRFGLQLKKDGSLGMLIPFTSFSDDYCAMSMVQSFHWKKDNGYLPDNWRK